MKLTIKKTAILILAAGSSSRLGEPKQLLQYQEKSLLWHACKKALTLSQDVYVVLGEKVNQCRDSISDLKEVNVIYNKNYQKGISTSIKAGIEQLLDFDAVLILLCDQPFIPTSHLQTLLNNKTRNCITTSFYEKDVAVPALFPKKYYQELLKLSGDSGAKKLIKQSDYIKIVLDEEFAFDIDKQEDKKRLVEKKQIRKTMKNSKLFEEFKLNEEITLQNRIAMAPVSRCFADKELVPTEDMVKYYSRRSDLGLIITEATLISKEAQGYPNQPGIFTKAQIEAWRKITKEVHKKGGKVFSQLFHAGRLSHSTYTNTTPLAPSAIAFDEKMPRSELMYEKPKTLTKDEINKIISDFVQAAKNSIEAGFDGIEFHAANGYLPDQFLHQITNQREDEYGGSVENRARFVLETIDKIIEAIGKNRVAIRLSPHAYLHLSYTQKDEDTFIYLLKELEKRELAYIHTGIFDDSETVPYLKAKVSEFLRNNYKGKLIGNGSYSVEQSNEAIKENKFDIIAFGRLAIANPNLLEKIKENKPLEAYDNDLLNTLI